MLTEPPSLALAQASKPAIRPSSGAFATLLPVVLFSLLWLDLIRLLSVQWATREQYAYGWFVPLLTAALLWRRWLDRPSGSQPLTLNPQRFLLPAFCFLLFLLLPLRVIYEINADWPLIGWLYTFIVVATTLYLVWLAGGWPWTRHFAFPICFTFVAVVWPYRLEKALTQDLMQIVAGLTVELLGWLNIPALQRGNLIDLGTGTVGIDEACSGIRSFQSNLMAALFMGELYRLRAWSRLALLAAGITLGFCFNVVRTLLLSCEANREGLGAIEKWHDPAGLTITVACFFCLWGLALLIQKWERKRQHAQVPPPEPRQPQFQLSTFNFQLLSIRPYLLAVGAWAVLSLFVTEAWYRAHEITDLGAFHWAVRWPTNSLAYKQIELPKRTRELIAYDAGGGSSWSDTDGYQWTAYFFRWNPASIRSVFRARIHRPERCLPAAGLRLVTAGGSEKFEAGGLELPFQKYTYQAEGQTLHVFFCQWEDGSEKQGGMWSSKLADRIRSVLVGRRKLGQQTLEVVITGPPTLEAAAAALRKALPALIQLEPARSQPISRSRPLSSAPFSALSFQLSAFPRYA